MNRNLNRDAIMAHAHAAGLAGVIASQGEAMHAMGIYHCQQFAPTEHLRGEYIELRDKLELLNRARRFDEAKAIEADIRRIPQIKVWEGPAPNLVVTVGKNAMLDNHLSGSSYTAAWYLGLISGTGYTTGPAAGDTAASHPGWTEAAGYSNSTRPSAAWQAAAAGSKTLTSGLVFNINAAATIKGVFLINNSTKSGTTGILFSAGLFTGGDQPVVDGNTLTANYTLSV